MNTALIVGNWDLPPRALIDRYGAPWSFLVAADGGADRALKAGLEVDHVVGDLDGIRSGTRRRLGDRVHLDADPDRTDLEKALAFAWDLGAERAVLVGVIGGRLDHTLATLATAARWAPKLPIVVVDPMFVTRPVMSELRARAPKGTVVSILSPGGARGVSTGGLRFPLRDHALDFSPLGLHNEVVRSSYWVRVETGLAFVMQSHRPRPDF